MVSNGIRLNQPDQATILHQQQHRDLVAFPTPTVALTLPECAIHYCQEYLAAGIACATEVNINSCYCAKLTWPTACASVCDTGADLSSVASWYWALCPKSMDSRLGMIGVSKALVTGFSGTVDAWAVQTGAVTQALISATGYDCYYSSKCGTAAIVSSSTSTSTSTSPPSTILPVSDSHAISGGTIALIVCLTVISIVLIILLILLVVCLRRRRRRALPPLVTPNEVAQINPDILLDIIWQTNDVNNANMREMTAALERLNAERRETRTTSPRRVSNTRATTRTEAQVSSILGEHLTCPICHELYHRPVTVLSPMTNQNGGCLHSFCGGCIVKWLERNNTCPSDRARITGFNDNRNLSDLVEAFLQQFPEKARNPNDIADLDRHYRLGQRFTIRNTTSRT